MHIPLLPVFSRPHSHCVSLAVRIACAAAILAVVPSLHAQVAPVNQGNVLDANPQVGAGGSNRPVQGYVPINGNDLATGNVTGLGYLHIREPYSSPYGFGRINVFDRFNAVSAPLVIPQNNAQSIYRSYYNPGQTFSAIGPNGTLITPRAIGNGYDSNFGLSGYNNYPQNNPQQLAAPPVYNPLQPSNLDLPYRDYNDIPVPTYDPMVSDLYGLRVQPITPAQFANPAATQPGGLNSTTQPDYGDQIGTGVFRSDNGVGSRVQGQTNQIAVESQLTTQPAGTPQEARVGQTNTPEQLLAQGDIYANLLAIVNKSKQQNLAQSSTSTQLVANATWKVPEIKNEQGFGTGRFATLGPGGVPVLGPSSDTDHNPDKTAVKTQSDSPQLPNYQAKVLTSTEDPLQSRAILQAGRKVKTIETLAGKTRTTFNGVMQQAENLMKQGDYLHAAEFYQGAISLEPDNALAVVGRAHAELAAGLYESGAYDLKFLYHRHPELMAVHYDLPAFMTQKRLDFVTDDVRVLAKKGVAAASFLACYFDYQNNRQDMLLQDFSDWYARHPNDPWGPIVEKAWVEAEAQDNSAGSSGK